MSTIPTYALYGQYLDTVTPQYLHYETIRDRSREHNWSIKPHKHQRLCQIFFLRSGNVKLQLGTLENTTVGPVAIFIPPPVVHKFDFPKNIDGSIVTLEFSQIHNSIENLSLPKTIFEQALLIECEKKEFEIFERIFQQIETCFLENKEFKNTQLKLLSAQLLVSFAQIKSDNTSRKDPRPLSRQEERAQDFVALLEANYNTSSTVNFYANQLNISAVQLTRTCRNILGRSPNDLIISRKLLEAKRLLKFSQMSIHEIAYALSFNNIGYFSRLFKLKIGMSPSDYRNSDM